jgi:prepilin-type N-terminal cleavage/methylation domain-containing protein
MRAKRPGFTLTELLVVIGLILVLASLLLMVNFKTSDQRRVLRAADQLQGWLLVAKQRAVRDRAPRGVRIEQDGSTLSYVESPDPWTPALLGRPSARAVLTVPATPRNAVTLLNATPDLAGMVSAGDELEIVEPPSGHVIGSVGANGQLGLQSPVPGPSPLFTDNYRIYRRPIPMTGEAPLQLPKETAVDAANSRVGGTAPAFPLTILYTPGGKVVGVTGNVVLWVGDTAGVAAPTLIVVYPRTGLIANHPVDGTPGGDPYSFTKDGQSSGM